jgi:sugar diacid utilization regulator
VFGVLLLADAEEKAGDLEADVLEYGAVILAMELTRLQTLANTTLRLGDDLIVRLISDPDLENALARVRASGWEFQGLHNVAVMEMVKPGPDGNDALFSAARRAAPDDDIGSLMARHNGGVVIIAKSERRWNHFHRALTSELDGRGCRIGIGGACQGPADFPRSYQEAKLCLRLRETVLSADGVISFDQLGVYQILAGVEQTGTVERFVQQWVGPLLEYDSRRHAQLFETLSRYLECGRNHVATAHALNVHRNTLKYRLQRIEQISGNDLSDPDTTFNLQLATRAWSTLSALRAPG